MNRLNRRQIVASLMASMSIATVPALRSSVLAQDSTPSSGSPECVPNELDGSCLPVADLSARVDVVPPVFSNPTNITNPLFPVSVQHSVLMLGIVEGGQFRTEVTLLPYTKMIKWNGQQVETLVSQYMAYIDGRLEEVALDWYAQADDGAVWYFGEDVFNYENGAIKDTDGTWIADANRPPGMIMPGDPQVGDVYRPENLPGEVFEEVTISEVGVTVDGPLGPVQGALIVSELHQDGTTEMKIFAPGYGEFQTGSDNDVEALVFAIPTDAIDSAPPASIADLVFQSLELIDIVAARDSADAATTFAVIGASWKEASTDTVPQRITDNMDAALGEFEVSTQSQEIATSHQAAIDIARTSLDLMLRYQTPVATDLARFSLTVRQLELDLDSRDLPGILDDVTRLEWIRDRLVHALDPDDAEELNAALVSLRGFIAVGDFDIWGDVVTQLHAIAADGTDAEGEDDGAESEDSEGEEDSEESENIEDSEDDEDEDA